jgi:hypothetical protein
MKCEKLNCKQEARFFIGKETPEVQAHRTQTKGLSLDEREMMIKSGNMPKVIPSYVCSQDFWTEISRREKQHRLENNLIGQ